MAQSSIASNPLKSLQIALYSRTTMPTLLLIDGHSQAYRAFFGMKTPLSTRTGELTGAVYGFARKLLSVIREYRPDCVATAFDLGDTWRHAEFSDYKATRDQMPDEMRSQLDRIQQLLQVFNIPIVTYPNYEADDVLGTLARQAAEQGTNVLILTGDRDMFQLVNDQVQILYTSGGPNPTTSVYGPTEIHERYGLAPDQFIDFKALTGDTSDNIPGVPGVGEKTAVKLLQEFGTLENLLDHIDQVKGPKLQQNLTEYADQVRRNKRLVTIETGLDVQYDAKACLLRDYNQEQVYDLFHELEFRSLLKELPQSNSPVAALEGGRTGGDGQMALFGEEGSVAGAAEAPSPYLCVGTTGELEQVAAALQEAEYLSFDVETTSQDAMRADLVGLGVAWAPGEGAYIPLAHTAGDQLAWEVVREALQPAFANAALPKLAHNGKYDLTVALRHGLAVNGPIHDTMLLAWLLDPASRMLGLKAQAAELLGWRMTEISTLIGSGRKQITIDQAPIDQVAAYCGADVDATLQIFQQLAPKVKEAGLWRLYEEVELPLLPVLTDMEMTGVLLDTDFLAEMSTRFNQRLGKLHEEMFALVGHEFNLRSTQQMSQVLFGEMGFPTRGITKTSSGQYSTAVGELEKLAAMSAELSADQQRLLEIIFEQRQLEKLRGTYVDALPNQVNPETGRIHTNYNQTGSSTGRLSSSNPNLQNIPIRTELGREIRRAFVAPPGWLLISADYSQVELRILAHVAQEEALIEAFRADQDIHVATAARLFGVPIEAVNRDQRGLAKTINFATIYGSSAFGISVRTDMDTKQAGQFMEQYFQTYPKIRDYIGKTTAQLHAEGYVQTLLGRKRFFPELKESRLPYNQRSAVERAAINAPIQGTAADIMKIAMIRLHERLKVGGYQARMLLQVHDELVLELPPEEKDEVVALVREVMCDAYELDAPLKVDVEGGPNWYDLGPV
jgi:DNA polymerase I